MAKWLIKVLGILLLSSFLFVLGAVFGNYKVKASPRKTYHSDMAVPSGLQKLLDIRTSEGWQFVAVSEGNQDGNTVLVVVFEKE